jgi:hypothetical protein
MGRKNEMTLTSLTKLLKLGNWLKRNYIDIILSALILLIMLYINDPNIIRSPKEYLVEREIIFSLNEYGVYRPSSYFDNADTVCFLPFYGVVQNISVSISKKTHDELTQKIDRKGRSDSYWWIVGIKGEEVGFLYNIRRKVHRYNKYPQNNAAICIGSKDFVLKSLPSEKGEHNLIFEVFRKEE